MDVGLELRQARERRDISLQQLSHATKISPRVLQAIEAADPARLPALVFTRAFVKTYAEEVGLDPEDTMRRYLDQLEPPEPAPESIAMHPDREPIEPPRQTPPYSPGKVLRGRFGTAGLLALVAVTAIALAVNQHARATSAQEQTAPAVATAGFVPQTPASPAAVGTSGQTAAPLDALHVTIAPTGPCWVQASVGDERVFGALLAAGVRRTVDAGTDLTLRVGDPSTFAFEINGQPARVAGPAGQAVTVHVTRDNYAQYLAR
jgi:cytoskeletal protein RodZ